jgi:hypothetical protein
MNMLKYLLLASAFSISVFATAQAAVERVDAQGLSTASTTNFYQMADKNRGSGSSGHDDNDDNDSADDNSGGNDSVDDNGGDDNDASGSGRRKPRTPGGSGCDDAGDVAEHAECRT